ncbi:unnamed protein product [Victoria cruziana]
MGTLLPLHLPASTTNVLLHPYLLPTAAVLLASLFLLRRLLFPRPNLPPGPPGVPIFGNLLQIRPTDNSYKDFIRRLRAEYGPIFTIRLGNRTTVVISSPELAHEALIQKGPSCSSRPRDSMAKNLFSCNKFTVNSATYGPIWRALRRNMVSEMLAPSRTREFKPTRMRAMDRLIARLRIEADQHDGAVLVLKNARFAVFSILLYMCFGVEMEEDEVFRVEELLKRVIFVTEPRPDDFVPLLRPLYRKQRKEAESVRRAQLEMLLPIINRRREFLKKAGKDVSPTAYVDTLFDLTVDGRPGPRTDGELVTLCAEFLNGGTDTTACGLEWAIARLIMDPAAQDRLAAEVRSVTGGRPVEDADVERLEYVNAFVKELLRRHPPVHFTVTHMVSEPMKLSGYDIPAGTAIDFYTAAIAEDPVIWDSPEKFVPERFVGGRDDVDMTGVRNIKMMPFGVGRRICPGLAMGTLHMNLLLARMVQEFEWARCPGSGPMDLGEKYAFTVVMREPLKAVIRPRTAAADGKVACK